MRKKWTQERIRQAQESCGYSRSVESITGGEVTREMLDTGLDLDAARKLVDAERLLAKHGIKGGILIGGKMRGFPRVR